MELDEAIEERHSVRKFSDKAPNWRNVLECIDAARHAPVAGGIHTMRFVLITDEEKIRELAEASQQDFVGQAKCIVVACSAMSRTKDAYGENAETWCRQQAGASIQNFLLKVEEFGMATCWVGHFVEDHVKRILKIPGDVTVEALFPVGYELGKSKTRRAKISLDKILYFNRYGNVHMRKEEKRVR